MKEKDFIDAMNAIELDKTVEDQIIKQCENRQRQRRSNRRPVWAAAVACAAVLALLVGIPLLRHNNDTGKMEVYWLDALTIQASAKGFDTEKLEKNIVTRIPSGTCILFVEEERNGQKTDVVGGTVAPDFVIDGEGIKSISYTSETGLLFCEFDSYFHDKKGNYIWSVASASVPMEQYATWCADIQAPTKKEMVRILDDLHSRQELIGFYNQMYTPFLAELEKKQYSWEKEQELIQEKYREPIDFNQFTLDGEVVQDHLVIEIINPEHPPLGTVQARSITASPGDTVSWIILEEITGMTRDELDPTRIRDNIHVAVTYEDGTVRECVIALQFSADGELSIELKE